MKYLLAGALVCFYPLSVHGATSYAKMEFVRIPAGIFTMGEDGEEVPVQLSAFSLGKTEVTQAQWKAVMGYNPSYFKGDNLPVESVSWEDAMNFCKRLTEREHNAGRLPQNLKFTLPSEAQWEYACRAGTKTRFSFGDSDALLPQYGNFRDKSFATEKFIQYAKENGIVPSDGWNWNDGFAMTAPVGSFLPNAWGLYDMHGNVCEWCLDYNHYEPLGGIDPIRTTPGFAGYGEFGTRRITRGGSFLSDTADCSSTGRYPFPPKDRIGGIGFRVAIVRTSNP